jgi:hypothetical protein
MRAWIAVVVVGLTASTARADHQEMMMDDGSGSTPAPFDASVSLIAASYSTISYVGDYQGALASIMWQHDRFMFGAGLGMYHINLNGLDQHGIGDLMVHVATTLVHDGELSAGVVAMVTAPTGDDRFGLGMGHTMAMPSFFGVWSHDRVTVSASVGYSRAIAQMEAGHDHGVWPLVEPMNMSEISWGAGCDLALGRGVHAGARASGGHPFDLPGHERVYGAARVGWGTGRVDTSAELQTGFVGDPFNVRGLVETALHF